MQIHTYGLRILAFTAALLVVGPFVNAAPERSAKDIFENEFHTDVGLYQRHLKDKKIEPKISQVLNDDEKVTIYAYTVDLYKDVNAAMRKNEKAKYSEYIAKLKSSLEKLPKFEGIVRRRTDLPVNVAKEYVVGAIVQDPAFLSTSRLLRTEGQYRMTIKSKTGREIGGLSAFPQEKEVLFLPDTKFKVLAIHKQNDGTTQFDLEDVTE